MSPVEITVTAEHIAAGKQCDCVKCPVALAIMAALRPLSIDVQADIINFGLPGGR